MESKRPKIKIAIKPFDVYLECMSVFVILVYFVILIYGWTKLPDIIPTHFDLTGKIDGYGSKSTFFLLLPVIIVFYALFTVLSKFPHVYNYPVPITEENAEIQYSKAVRLMRYLKLVFVVVFTYLQFCIMNSALHQKSELSILFLPISLIIVFVPLGYYIYLSAKER